MPEGWGRSSRSHCLAHWSGTVVKATLPCRRRRRRLLRRRRGLVVVPRRSALAARRKSAPHRKRSPPCAAPPAVLAVAVRDASFSPPLRLAPAPARAKPRKYACPVCHKVFLWAAHLKRHMYSHRRRKGSTSVVADEGLLQKMQSVLRSLQEKHQPTSDSAKSVRPPASALSASASAAAATPADARKRRASPPAEGASECRPPARRPNARGYVCPVCHKTFPWLCVLKSHIQSHADVRVYRCGKCDFATTVPHALTEHLFSHVEREPAKCQACAAEFASTRFLIRHINSVHGYPTARPRAAPAHARAL